MAATIRPPDSARAIDSGCAVLRVPAMMAITANRFQISKVTYVKAVLRNLHDRSAPPANCSPLYLAPTLCRRGFIALAFSTDLS